jgi:shikimate kinase/shikimate 5-dehydrogenase
MIFKSHHFHFLIGHRGVGKSYLLKQIKPHLPDFVCLDLDNVIENQSRISVSEYFRQYGEKSFRELEQSTLKKMTEKYSGQSVIIALGAGFELPKFAFPQNSIFIQVARKTDSMGRIFPDRPLWNTTESPLTQYKNRYQERTPIFDAFCDHYLELPEGFQLANIGETVLNPKSNFETIVTLKPWHIQKSERIEFLLKSSLIHYLEVRTDLISYQDYKKIKDQISQKKVLLSIRSGGHFFSWLEHEWDREEILIDCDISLLDSLKRKKYFILSSHAHEHPKIPDNKGYQYTYLKWSPILNSFFDWDLAMRWQEENCDSHILAPRTNEFWRPSSQSEWMRLLLANRQKLNFIRTDLTGSYEGQPHWLTWSLLKSDLLKSFYAVIGNPISHSYSPMLHLNWSTQKQSQFLKIPVTNQESSEIISIFKSYGLKGLAITSPLKTSFQKNTSVNTAKIVGEEITFTNTDQIGIWVSYQLIKKFGVKALYTMSLEQMRLEIISLLDQGVTQLTTFLNENILIFGGGGLLSSLQTLFPNAYHLPARTQETKKLDKTSFELIIWSAPPDAKFEREDLNFDAIWDVNYHEQSLARELALKRNLPYLSGLSLFIAQGIAQQRFWS